MLNDFLDFSSSERKGIWFLLFCILAICCIRWYWPEKPLIDNLPTVAEIAEMEAWEKTITERILATKVYPKKRSSQSKKLPEKSFDPNEYGIEDWQSLGFSPAESKSIVRYQQAINGFKFKSDLRKLYAFDDEYFEQISPFLLLPEKPAYTAREGDRQQKKTPELSKIKAGPIEINSADSVRLLSIRGIGPYWAKRILRYRTQWGGFYDISQLQSMKGFPDSLFQKIKTQVIVDTNLIQKIAINTISDENLLKHPIGWYGVGKSIVNYRLQHGPFRSAEDLQKMYALKPDQLEVILHYAVFQ